MNNIKNMKGGIILSYISLFFSIFAGIFITPIVIKNVGTSNYGLFSFSYSVTSWLTILSSALVASYIHFAVRDYKSNGNEVLINSIFTKILIYIGLIFFLLFSIILASLYFTGFSLPQYTSNERNITFCLLFLSALQVCFSIVCSVFSLFISYKEKFIFFKTVALLTSIANFLLNLILSISTKSIIAIGLSSLIVTIFSNLLYMLYAFKTLRMKIKWISLKKVKPLVIEICCFSLIILLNVITNEINNQVDKQILGIFVNSESVTLYSLSFSFVGYISTMSTAVSAVFVPLVNRNAVEEKFDEINDLYIKVSLIQTIIIVMVFCGFIAVGKEFIELWIGGICDGYQTVYFYTIVLLAIHLIPNCSNLFIEIQRAYGKIKFRAIVYLIAAFVNIVLTILFVKIMPPKNSIWACVIGTAISTILGSVICLGIYNQKVLRLPIGKIYLKIFLYTCFGSVIALLIQYCSSFGVSLLSNMVFKGILFVIIYLPITLLINSRMIKTLLIKN